MIAADSAVGKSTLATQTALHAACCGHGVCLLNLEMPEEAYCIRTVANFAQVNAVRALNHELSNEEMSRMTFAFSDLFDGTKGRLVLGNGSEHREIPALKKLVDDTARLFRARGTELRLIIVDHILKVRTSVKRGDKDAEGIERSDLLRWLATKYDAHVIALAHVTRNSARDGAPTKNDIAGSAWFDRDVDNVMMFNQERGKDMTFDPNEPARLSCQKCRWGQPFAVELTWQRGFFHPWSLKPSANPFEDRTPEQTLEDIESRTILHNQKNLR